jgi:hypothetical protein
MSLLEAGQAMAADVALWLGALDDPEMPLEEMGKLALEQCNNLRSLAILVLLVKGDVDKFHHNLIRSGRCRAMYLERVHRERDFEQHDFASGCFQPFLDAVAAGDIPLARHIAALSPAGWRKGHEYEDDFFYAQILHRLIEDPVSVDEASSFATRLESLRVPGGGVRAAVCSAIIANDQASFDSAFDDFLAHRELEIDTDVERGELESPAVLAQRKIYVDALALLRLAQRRGLITQSEYEFCPALARQPMVSPVPDD